MLSRTGDEGGEVACCCLGDQTCEWACAGLGGGVPSLLAMYMARFCVENCADDPFLLFDLTGEAISEIGELLGRLLLLLSVVVDDKTSILVAATTDAMKKGESFGARKRK